MDFKKIVYDNQEKIIKTFQGLLKIPSVLDYDSATPKMPFGKDINNALIYMLELAKKDGFIVINDDGYAGEISYKTSDSKESVGILCHLDVVPAGNKWTYPPYEARIVDGKIYARGTTDDKGPTIASYFALKFIKDANIKLKKEIKIILGTDEETSWRGIEHYLKKYPMPSVGFAPDCSFPLVYGEKGRMSFDLSTQDFNDEVVESIKGGDRYNVVMDEVVAILKVNLAKEFNEYLHKHSLKGFVKDNKYTIEGVAAHAMEPEKGINAGLHMCNFLKDYSKHPLIKFLATYFYDDPYFTTMNLDYDDFEMGPIPVNIGIMAISCHNVRVTLDSRFPVRYDIDRFNQIFNELLIKYNLFIATKTYKNPHYVNPNDELVKLLYEAYVKNTGDTINKPFTVGGGTYAGILDKGVAYGMGFPGELDLAHQKDECLAIESLLKGILIYIDAILSLGEIDA